MTGKPFARRVAGVVGVAVVASTLGAALPATAAVPGHTTLVGTVPATKTPNMRGGEVDAIFDTGTGKVLLGGTFTQAQNHGSSTTLARGYLLSFDKTTGLIDTAFHPTLSNPVTSIIAGPTAGTVYIGGQFNTVNGTTRRKVAEINYTTGALVTTFGNVGFNATVFDLATVHGHLIATGIFVTAGTATRNGLASLNPTTGAVDSYLTVALTGHHNFNGTGANAGVGGNKLSVTPDGTAMWVIGNFKNANGTVHDQIAKIDTGTTSATLDTWNTTQFQATCNRNAFDSWIRNIAMSPNGSYFVVVATGGPFGNTVLCDSATRWETGSTGTNVLPTWTTYTGGDTILSTAVSEVAVYIGGHFRWVNNSFGSDRAGAGAVGRASIAALDPLSGLPLSWNPGRNPRGVGVDAMMVNPDGLWLGYDTNYLGNNQYLHERFGRFNLAGGRPVASTATASLPGNVYFLSPSSGVNAVQKRSYDGSTAVGARTTVTDPSGTTWSSARGAFWVGGTLFYGWSDGNLRERTFNGTTWGTPSVVDPYHDNDGVAPDWDTVQTGSGQTYQGVTTSFYSQITSVTGIFYSGGKIFYSRTGQNGLFWRWFTPDTGTVGAQEFSVAGSTGFSDSGGLFTSGGNLYMVSHATGNLTRQTFVNGVPGSTRTTLSGPAIDGVDWRANGVLVGP